MIIVTTIKLPADPQRAQEYNLCLRTNCENESVEKIIVFLEGEQGIELFDHSKIEIIPIVHRAVLNRLIEYGSRRFPGKYLGVCNADICFDLGSGLEKVTELQEGSMWALARHHCVDGTWQPEFPPNWGSYDTFIFKAPLPEINLPLDLEVGRAGCDSYLVACAIFSGIPVANPSLSIVSKHFHSIADRSHSWFSETEGRSISYHDLPDYLEIMRIAPACSLEDISYITDNAPSLPPINEPDNYPQPAKDKFMITPFNRDSFLHAEVARLIGKWQVSTAFETGTYRGHTTIGLSLLCEDTLTVEINEESYNRACQLFELSGVLGNISADLGPSPESLRASLPDLAGKRVLFYLDAHWEAHWPLLDELSVITDLDAPPPVIVIHDCKVPDRPDLGFDSYNGQDLDFSYVKEHLQAIYGKQGFHHYYNQMATGANRGIIFIEPKI